MYAAIFGFVASLKRTPSYSMISVGTAIPAFVAVSWWTQDSYRKSVVLASGEDSDFEIEDNHYYYYYMTDWGLVWATTLFMLMQMACLGGVVLLSIERFIFSLMRWEGDDRSVHSRDDRRKKMRAEALNRAFDDDRRRDEIISRRGYDGRRGFDRESGIFDRRDS